MSHFHSTSQGAQIQRGSFSYPKSSVSTEAKSSVTALCFYWIDCILQAFYSLTQKDSCLQRECPVLNLADSCLRSGQVNHCNLLALCEGLGTAFLYVLETRSSENIHVVLIKSKSNLIFLEAGLSNWALEL